MTKASIQTLLVAEKIMKTFTFLPVKPVHNYDNELEFKTVPMTLTICLIGCLFLRLILIPLRRVRYEMLKSERCTRMFN